MCLQRTATTAQASAVAGDKPTTFFDDEWRNPVYVRDLERLVRLLIQLDQGRRAGGPAAEGEQLQAAAAAAAAPRQHRVYNAGGPERLSRVDMARQVADCLGCGHGAIVAAPSASVSRGVASPPDISMDVSRLQQDLGFSPRPFREALRDIFPAAGSQ
ncbi:hypothetical protein TSOC_003465 [Tetrabaena socialis]|uniref:RmlD-like substrate binding domain-containing protein n=1 Tax=Tetrabaena socialis TaxID=47790 RepID=A0A2J8ABF7_9CHLO|nr:hypothetical protein TSOC_003465 [Tetrabaena socialis]|eukprot:PNH09865.1 hypothetical protein TSOC_003465 [Tetrabaena socialis]